jgi:3-methyladenine DNA glycosylase AlkD
MNDFRSIVSELTAGIDALPVKNTAAIRAVRKAYSRRIKSHSPREVLELARQIIRTDENLRWVAYELVHFHRPALHSLGHAELEALGKGMDSWDKVDTFAPLLSGVAWRRGQIPDAVIHAWAASEDRWWRRAALVSTIALNTKARGGKGDVPRTLAVCLLLLDDRDDMVVKAMSWALRELIPYDPETVRRFLSDHDGRLAARIKREARNKLDTGLKNPSSSPD